MGTEALSAIIGATGISIVWSSDDRKLGVGLAADEALSQTASATGRSLAAKARRAGTKTAARRNHSAIAAAIDHQLAYTDCRSRRRVIPLAIQLRVVTHRRYSLEASGRNADDSRGRQYSGLA
jgi:hypothetical protein